MSIAKFTSSMMSVFEPTPSRAGRLTSRGQNHKIELLKTSATPMKSDDSQNPWYQDQMTVGAISAVALLALYAAYSCYSNGSGYGYGEGSYNGGGYSGYNGTYGGQEEGETTCPANFSSFSGNPFAPAAIGSNPIFFGPELPDFDQTLDHTPVFDLFSYMATGTCSPDDAPDIDIEVPSPTPETSPSDEASEDPYNGDYFTNLADILEKRNNNLKSENKP